MLEVCIETGYLALGNCEDEMKVKNRHKNHSKRVVRNVEGRNEGTIREKSSNKD